ncbi:MAG TPA: OsmC family protein [Bacteroidales bacterium]|nr:OsmC family protein [Bacteroidales bacterium]HPT01933.1 OsmC family protein [Bacteroidales bacterium]
MEQTLSAEWKGNMKFEAQIDGHKITIDSSPELGGNDEGPRPKKLMLLALAGCTGMDVVSILKKMHVELDSFDVDVIADITAEHPMHYTHMHIVYIFGGKDLPMDKLQKAISLSQERYCGVSYMYRKAMEITHEIVIKQ